MVSGLQMFTISCTFIRFIANMNLRCPIIYCKQVIGIGKRMKLKIGQRKHLSEIDIAQLRAMYYCNKKDQRDKG